ncbi:TPA: hypothetical protein ACICD0_001386 [Campylobacter jejuni]
MLYKHRKLPDNCNLTLLEPVINQKTKVLVRCKCGKEYYINPQSLFRKNNIKECYKCSVKTRVKGKGLIINKLRQHPVYSMLDHIKQRCYNKNCKAYKYYGAIGIDVCEEWRNDYYSFCKWAEDNGYKKGLSIDRIDPNKGYYPDNCRFIPLKEQRENKHKQVNNTSGHTGISFAKNINKWHSYVNVDGKRINCGYFNNINDAVNARNAKIKELKLNYIRKDYINV